MPPPKEKLRPYPLVFRHKTLKLIENGYLCRVLHVPQGDVRVVQRIE